MNMEMESFRYGFQSVIRLEVRQWPYPYI